MQKQEATKEIQTHINSYELEKSKDTLLKTIKMICLMYLENRDNINNILTSKLIDYFKYIEDEYMSIHKLKESLKIQTYFQPYNEIYTNLDSIIMKDNLICKQEKISFIELTKDINYLEDTLAYCYGVLNLIIKDRNEN